MAKKENGISSVLINESDIEERVKYLAKKISDDYRIIIIHLVLLLF